MDISSPGLLSALFITALVDDLEITGAAVAAPAPRGRVEPAGEHYTPVDGF
jgi:hypothetical protein